MGHSHISIYDGEYGFALIWDESAGTQWGSKGKDEHTEEMSHNTLYCTSLAHQGQDLMGVAYPLKCM